MPYSCYVLRTVNIQALLLFLLFSLVVDEVVEKVGKHALHTDTKLNIIAGNGVLRHMMCTFLF